MKDLHCHILMGIDDGCANLEESLTILSKAKEEGVTDIMLTPHFIKGSMYDADNQKKQQLYETLKKEVFKRNIEVNLYLGNEVYIDSEILKLIKSGKVKTLNDSRYILFELPFSNKINNLKDILFELLEADYIPIMAHPERYDFVQKDPLILKEYLDMGVLFQGNYKSLFGKYGMSAKKTLKILLKNNLIQFLASDIHKVDSDYKLDKLYKKLKRIVKGEDTVKNLLEHNFLKVINDEEIIV